MAGNVVAGALGARWSSWLRHGGGAWVVLAVLCGAMGVLQGAPSHLSGATRHLCCPPTRGHDSPFRTSRILQGKPFPSRDNVSGATGVMPFLEVTLSVLGGRLLAWVLRLVLRCGLCERFFLPFLCIKKRYNRQ